MSISTSSRCALGLLALALFTLASCDPSLTQPLTTVEPDISSPTNPTADVIAPPTIVMGSFNIQVLGQAKLANPQVTDVLVDICRRFDILAVQELRSVAQDPIPRLLAKMNVDGSKFRAVVGPRQGYTISKEQYVIIFDSEKIEYLGPADNTQFQSSVVANAGIESIVYDASGFVHRSPMAAQFRCRHLPAEQAFTFTLLNIHVDPNVVEEEHQALVAMMRTVRQSTVEDDIILIGDLNAPPRYFQSFPWFANQYAAILDDWQTKTRRPLNRDNIVFDANKTAEFQRQAGVVNIMQDYGLTVDQAAEVSDHLPVWAIFSTREASVTDVVQLPTTVR